MKFGPLVLTTATGKRRVIVPVGPHTFKLFSLDNGGNPFNIAESLMEKVEKGLIKK